jgi:arylsulfatase A-like enzyme/tetratricopeptide (TPR) repeat protein
LRSVVRILLPAVLISLWACRPADRFLARDTPVVLISVDTLRADHLPVYGYGGVATPNIDALRKDSVLFANAYTHVPLTLPSHTSLLTGLLPPQNGVRDNYGYSLPANIETLAALLQRAGYATGAAVSSAVLSRESGLDRGFELYDDKLESTSRTQGRPPNRDAAAVVGDNGEVVRVDRDGARSAEALLRWLADRRRQPFFAFLHLYEPHAPCNPPEPYRSRYPLAYDGEIARADEIVGTFLGSLRRWGLYQRALVIFVSDHGEGLSDHGEREHGVFLYREAIHVPLLVKFPGNLRAGESVSAPVALTDVFPTVTRVLGLTLPAGRNGVPLTAFLQGSGAPARRIYCETLYPRLRLGWSDLASLVDARYQYIEAPRPELYDISVDPAEKRDLSRDLSAPFRAMRAELEGMERPFEMPGSSGPEQTKKLMSLGYLSATSPSAKTKNLPDPKDRIGELDGSIQFGRLLAQGRYVELIGACRAFLKKDPAVIEIWRLMADALERTGKRAEAIAALKEGLRASSATALPALRMAAVEHLTYLLIQSGQTEEALSMADPDSFSDTKALNAVGVALGKAGHAEEARRAFQKVLSIDPEHPVAHFNLGTALLDSGDVEAARDHFEHAVRSDPKYASAWNALGQARVRLADEAGAIECWKQALELDGTQYAALYNLAVAEGRRGQLADARKFLERFVANAPPDLFAKDLTEARRLLRSLGRT